MPIQTLQLDAVIDSPSVLLGEFHGNEQGPAALWKLSEGKSWSNFMPTAKPWAFTPTTLATSILYGLLNQRCRVNAGTERTIDSSQSLRLVSC